MLQNTTGHEAVETALESDKRTENVFLYPPEESPVDRRIALVLFLLSFLYLCLFRHYTTMEPDEGIILQGAQRILRGEVLYRDFFSFFTPGSYYFVALLSKIFGSSILVARTALAFYGGIFSVVIYFLSRRVCTRGNALVVVGITMLTTLPFRFLILHNWDSTVWACLAVYSAVRLLESSNWKWAFASGSFISLTFLFEQSKGVGLGLGLALGWLAISVLDPEREKVRSLVKKTQSLGLVLGLAWPSLITLAYFGTRHSLTNMLADWLWPLQHYSLANRVPYGYQNWSDETRHALFGVGSVTVRFITLLTLSPCFLIPVLPLIGVGLCLYWMVQMRRSLQSRARCAYYVLIGATLSGLLLSVVAVRADILHFMYLQPLFCLVLAWIVDGHDIPGKIFKTLRPALKAYVVIAFLLFTVPLLIRTGGAPNKLTTRRGEIATPEKDTVVEYVQQHVAPGETILVYPYLPLYYYLTGTFSPTRLDYFQPGMNTGEQSQEMLSQLTSRPVRVVVFESSFTEKIPNSWPGTPLAAIANDQVADYILREYRSCKILKSPSSWRFLFMVRKDISCPKDVAGNVNDRHSVLFSSRAWEGHMLVTVDPIAQP